MAFSFASAARFSIRFLVTLVALFALGACARREAGARMLESATPVAPTSAAREQPAQPVPAAPAGVASTGVPSSASARKYPKPSDAELKKKLSSLEYEVTQHAETEPPFANRYWDNHAEGLYVDAASGEPLFSSRDKFHSGTGWPSFTRPVDPTRVVTHSDDTLGMSRTEVRSRDGDSHLGHVFDDGPKPTGLRYCINSASLRFVPVSQLASAGYADYLPLFGGAAPAPPAASATDNTCTAPAPGDKPGCSPTLETAVLAGGCFWGMEEILRKIPGVVSTEVGYTGGKAGVSYDDVHTGKTGDAEAVRIVFDPKRLSYADLLEKWFFRMHDPTTKNQQGNDLGSQYRSAIFVVSPEQRAIATQVKQRVEASGVWKRPLVTEITALGPFTRAEEYHQHYLEKNPGGYSCHYLRDFSDAKL